MDNKYTRVLRTECYYDENGHYFSMFGLLLTLLTKGF